MAIRLVLVTHPSREHAERIARGLLENKLAACILISEVKSMFNWQGELSEDNEVVTLLKTSEEKLPGLERWIDVQHEYEVPAIISFQASANASYETWLNDQLN